MEANPQHSSEGRKRVHSAVMGYKDADEEYYMKKITKLVKKKMKSFVEETESKLPPLATIETLKEFITNEFKGKDTTLVIKKILYASDLEKSQNRLSMPMNQLETYDFLTENERKDLENEKEFEVELLGPRLQLHDKPMVMKMWHLKSSNSYVLKTNWNDFVKENINDLKKNTKIQVWSFRRDSRLYFALACV